LSWQLKTIMLRPSKKSTMVMVPSPCAAGMLMTVQDFSPAGLVLKKPAKPDVTDATS
jgi:hypothetical protein